MKTALDFDTILENVVKMWKKQQKIRLFFINKQCKTFATMKGGEEYDRIIR